MDLTAAEAAETLDPQCHYPETSCTYCRDGE